jgi:hypothetical protein
MILFSLGRARAVFAGKCCGFYERPASVLRRPSQIVTTIGIILPSYTAKWNHTGFIKVASLAGVDVFISDEKFPAKARGAIELVGFAFSRLETRTTRRSSLQSGGDGAFPVERFFQRDEQFLA